MNRLNLGPGGFLRVYLLFYLNTNEVQIKKIKKKTLKEKIGDRKILQCMQLHFYKEQKINEHKQKTHEPFIYLKEQLTDEGFMGT